MLHALKKELNTLNGINRALHMFNFPEDYGNKKEYIISAIRLLFMNIKNINRTLSRKTLINKTLEYIRKYTLENDRISVDELSDILISYAPEVSNNVLDNLRNQDVRRDEKNNNIPIQKKDTKTVYGDSQNVHNSNINKSVISVLSGLHEKYKNEISKRASVINTSIQKFKDYMCLEIKHELIKKDNGKKKLVEDTFDYISKNLAVFGDQRLTLQDAIIYVWMFIEDHQNKVELQNRLLEEFKETNGYCTTGHVARLINVIQGYTDDEKLCIRISDNDRCKAVIRAYLNNCLQSCSDEEVIEGMLEGSEAYVKFIRISVAKKLLEWQEDFGKDIISEIINIVNDFAKTTVFS